MSNVDYLSLKRPCGQCPFRNDLPDHLKGWLGRGRIEEIVHDSLVMGKSFDCHKTVNHEEDGETQAKTGEEKLCAGAAIFLMHNNAPNQIMQIMGRLGAFDPKSLDMNSPVFRTREALVEWHT